MINNLSLLTVRRRLSSIMWACPIQTTEVVKSKREISPKKKKLYLKDTASTPA
jgi:hypothetical protein